MGKDAQYERYCSLFLILIATMWLGSYIWCAAGKMARSSDPGFLERHNYPEAHIRRPLTDKTWRHYPSRRKSVRRPPRARWLAFRLPPYDIPRAAPRNNPEFHVDRTHAAGGVCEQTKTALPKCIDRLWWSCSNSKLLLHGHAFKHYYIALLCAHILDHKTHEVWGSPKVQ